MAIVGLDYASARPSAAAIKAAGYDFVVRYLTVGGPGLPGKLLTTTEFADLIANDVAIAFNFETTADRMLDGYAAGVADANTATSVVASLGVPPDRRIVYFSADFDASPAQQAEIDDYLRGAISVLGLGHVGAYGSFYVCKRCLDNQTATWAWQTAAWSGGNVEPRAHIFQRIGTVTVDGVDCDVNEALILPDFGQHPVPAASVRSRRRDPSMELPPTSTRIDRQVPTDVVGGWCGAANLWLTANTGGATVYGVYQVVNRGSSPPQVTPLLTSPNGATFTQWWPAMYSLGAGTTSVVVNYIAPQGMQAHVEYQR